MGNKIVKEIRDDYDWYYHSEAQVAVTADHKRKTIEGYVAESDLGSMTLSEVTALKRRLEKLEALMRVVKSSFAPVQLEFDFDT